MAWYDELIPGRLNGIEIKIKSIVKSGGRRFTAHEFADVDGAFAEDSGGQPHRYEIEAFLVGDDYHVTLQQLEEVLDAGGDLEIDDPFRGTISGLRLEGEYTAQQSWATLGSVELQFSVVQCQAPTPLIFESLASTMIAKAGVVYVASSAMMTGVHSKKDPFGKFLAALDRGLRTLRAINAKVSSTLGYITEVSSRLREYESLREAMVINSNTLVATLQTFGRVMMAKIRSKAEALQRDRNGPGSGAELMRGIVIDYIDSQRSPEAIADYNFVSFVDGKVTEETKGDKADLDALNVLRASSMIASLAENLVGVKLPTAGDADLLANTLTTEIDKLLEASIGEDPLPPDLYDALLDLKVAAVRLLADIRSSLPEVVEFTPVGTTNLASVAWALVEDRDQLEAKLVELRTYNDLPINLLALPAGQPIKALR